MANLLPRDEVMFSQIEKEGIKVHPVLWTVVYHYIGDCIVGINLLLRYYIDRNVPAPKEEIKRILAYTKRMIDIIKKLANHDLIEDSDPDTLFQAIKKENLQLDKYTDELFGNYVRNDVYMIDLMVGETTDPLDTREVVPVDILQRIRGHIVSTMNFMERLRKVTTAEKAF